MSENVGECRGLGVAVDAENLAGVCVDLHRRPTLEFISALLGLSAVLGLYPERDSPHRLRRKALAAQFGIGLFRHEVDLLTCDADRFVAVDRGLPQASAEVASD